MNVRDAIADIMSLESIDELTSFLQSQPIAKIRRELVDRFDAVFEYVDADEWATGVRICEALAIVGWGSREQVDAISGFNGDAWETHFITNKGEYRFRFACWSKRKAGWTLWNPQFYASPDFPDRPPIDWKQNAHVTFPFVDLDALPSQRNYRLQMPIRMGMHAGINETSTVACMLRRELRQHLLDVMTPAAYGNAVERFYFTFHSPPLPATCEAPLKIGDYNIKHRAFYSDLYIDEEFSRLSRADQRAFIGRHLLVAIGALASKLKSRGIGYDIAAFRVHAEHALENWNQKGR
jgi:hypothetical protein